MSALILDDVRQMESPSISFLTIELIERFMNQLPSIPFCVKDRELRFIRVNTAMLKLAGAQSAQEMLGRTSRDFFREESWRRYEAEDRRVLETGQPITDQLLRSLRRDGTATWIMFGRWPVTGANGEIVGVCAIARNLSAPDRRSTSLGRVAPIIEHIQNNFAAPIDVAEFAKRAGISVSQLDRDFVSLFGLSPIKYQKKIRFERAQEMLLSTDLSVAEIAHACGYADQSIFTRNFRNAVGLSPRAYRHKHSGA
jgi:PAS domain S-box-containing protein